MSFVAKLYQDDRLAERHAVTLDGTLRNAQAEPHDVVIDNLSATGFRTAKMAGIAVGDVITLGIFGIGLRSAAVLRESDGHHGCQFFVPLNASELAFALAGLSPPDPLPLHGAALSRPAGAGEARATEWSLSARARILTIMAAGTLPWLGLGLIWRLF
jgi:hypothetical protein